MDVAAFHQTKHLTRVTADVKCLAIKFAAERIQGGHYFGDCLVAMVGGVWGRIGLGLFPYARIRFSDHLLTEIYADQIVLEDVVIEHVLSRFAQVDDPLGHRRRSYTKRHVLSVGSAGGVVVSADAADTAGNKVGIARVFTLHENAVTTKDRRR